MGDNEVSMSDVKATYDMYVVQGAAKATALSNKNFAKVIIFLFITYCCTVRLLINCFYSLTEFICILHQQALIKLHTESL